MIYKNNLLLRFDYLESVTQIQLNNLQSCYI